MGQYFSSCRGIRRIRPHDLAEAAGVTREVLPAVVEGRETLGSKNLPRVISALGAIGAVANVDDHCRTNVGRLRAVEIVPKHVRS